MSRQNDPDPFIEQIEMQSIDPEARSERPHGFWERSVNTVLDFIRNVNERVNKSTFGRVFRLRGCGHVSFALLWWWSSSCLAEQEGLGCQ